MNDETLLDELECARVCASRRPCWEVGAVGQDHTLTLTLWNSSRVEVSFPPDGLQWLVVRMYNAQEYDRYRFEQGKLPPMLVEAMLDMEIKPGVGRFAKRR
jgi:hypothetical protein